MSGLVKESDLVRESEEWMRTVVAESKDLTEGAGVDG